jgi:Gram-negative bacterial TonB protein C-terminal
MNVKASINESGRVTRVELLAPKDRWLVNLAAYVACNWKFAPALRNDINVSSEVILHFRFDSDRATPR